MEILYNRLLEYSKGTSEEACAFILGNKDIVWVDNISDSPRETFTIRPQDYLKHKKNITCIFHSHPKGGPPSEEDHLVCRRINAPMLICSVPDKTFYYIKPEELGICLQYTFTDT